jgi:hypothetical protein
MKEFTIAQTDEAYRFCRRIKEALLLFCGKTDAEAIELINTYWHHAPDMEVRDPLLYHEPPYYYARCIAHHPGLGDGDVNWYKDKSKWPPPEGWVFE